MRFILLTVLMSGPGSLLLGQVWHLPHGDWRLGLPYCVGAVMQALAWRHPARHLPVPPVRASVLPGASP